jgi:hypothetical protein
MLQQTIDDEAILKSRSYGYSLAGENIKDGLRRKAAIIDSRKSTSIIIRFKEAL